ncbi:MAG: helix-turn-helix transcriptional regulator [Planctomycetota bacterium]
MTTMEMVPVDCLKIRQLREERGWTLLQAAAAAKLTSYQHWQKVEAGVRKDPSVSTIQKMADALEVTVDDLLLPLSDDDA